ncbi:hypothetical protein [Methanohalophilus sp.]|uniref:hypothetical protein n=1 Tax=Methanohalophilus sp. TaxID=1966352 RepID=UPI002612A53F|nr:hypothetical protein [Methanohalophilus sp.]MDK2892762.1 hypothetical protein [Methanohalophilus sp.]
MRQVAIIFICIIITSLFLTPAVAQEESACIHIKEMYLRFDGDDATVTIYFDMDLFGDLYVFAFGSRHLEPELIKIFSIFDDLEIRKIGMDNAVIELANVSRQTDSYYLFDERELGTEVEELIILYPSGPNMRFNDVSEIPPLFYEVS